MDWPDLKSAEAHCVLKALMVALCLTRGLSEKADWGNRNYLSMCKIKLVTLAPQHLNPDSIKPRVSHHNITLNSSEDRLFWIHKGPHKTTAWKELIKVERPVLSFLSMQRNWGDDFQDKCGLITQTLLGHLCDYTVRHTQPQCQWKML